MGLAILGTGMLLLVTVLFRRVLPESSRYYALTMFLVSVGIAWGVHAPPEEMKLYAALNEAAKVPIETVMPERVAHEPRGNSGQSAGENIVVVAGNNNIAIAQNRPGNKTPDRGMVFNVIGEDGQHRTIEPLDKPVLFFSTWCSHCDDVLQALASLPASKRPVLACAYLESGNYADELNKARDKLWSCGLDDPVFVCTDRLNGKIDSLPTLVIQEDGHFQLVNGYEQIYRHFGLKKGGFYGSK